MRTVSSFGFAFGLPARFDGVFAAFASPPPPPPPSFGAFFFAIVPEGQTRPLARARVVPSAPAANDTSERGVWTTRARLTLFAARPRSREMVVSGPRNSSRPRLEQVSEVADSLILRAREAGLLFRSRHGQRKTAQTHTPLTRSRASPQLLRHRAHVVHAERPRLEDHPPRASQRVRLAPRARVRVSDRI